MGVNGSPQGADAFAMDYPHMANAALTAGGKIVVQQPGDLRWTKSMQIKLACNGEGNGFGRIVRRHLRMLATPQKQATKNPPLSRRVFDTHTLAKNELNN